MLKVSAISIAICAMLTVDAAPAVADGWPLSVVGTWSVLGNFSPGVLSISAQDNSGQCQFITGTIYGDPVQGFYCPGSGRIQLIRKRRDNNDTVQVWTGNLSQASSTLHMAGTFTAVDNGGGSLGEYSFNADK